MTTKKVAILASPLLCLGVLSVIAADGARHNKPKEADRYHANVKKAFNAFPHEIGTWKGNDTEIPDDALKLLRPNAVLSREYRNLAPGIGSWAVLMIIQCADGENMHGHYPANCYPSSGEDPVDKDPRPFHLKAGDTWIDGFEYRFLAKENQGCRRKSVYNFFVIPGRGVTPDSDEVESAAADCQRCYFGAAQFQVIMDADQPPEVRDNVFTTLIGADTGLIKTLENVNVKD